MKRILNYISVHLMELRDAITSEFKSIFSDSGVLLLIVIALPLYTIIYSTAYGSEVVRDVAIAVVDEDHSSSSRDFISCIASGPNTELIYEPQSIMEARELFYQDRVYGIVYIPHGFECNILSSTQANIGLILDGSHLLLYRQVLEQVASVALAKGASIEAMRNIERGYSKPAALATVEPVKLNIHNLYNPSLGYGSFVMPSVVMVIIQQTLIIGLAMIAARKRIRGVNIERLSPKIIFAKYLVYLIIYSINLLIILSIVWPAFGFPYNANTADLAAFIALYILASLSLGVALAQLFKRREAPLLLLLCTSVPILLLAGVSYPREAYDKWLYMVGRLLPSSSGVDGFIAIASRGATLCDVATEAATLVALSIIYITLAFIINKSIYARGVQHAQENGARHCED